MASSKFKVQSFIMAVATLFATSQGLAVVDGGHRRWVDTHWFRGNSYFQGNRILFVTKNTDKKREI
jgi:hypothetical protein